MKKRSTSSQSPSISQLRAFAAAAHHGSVSAGASALGISQSSASHAIAALERTFGAKLILRTSRVLTLTTEGSELLPKAQEILERLDALPGHVAASGTRHTLRLLVTPAFSSYFLLKRLPIWNAEHPGIELSFARHFLDFDQARSLVDAAILFGRGPWKDAEAVRVGGDEFVIVGREMKAFAGLSRCKISSRYLLHHTQIPNAWAGAAQAASLAIADDGPGMVFDLFSHIIDAAKQGLGVALVPAFIANHCLQNEGLVPLLEGRTFKQDGAYHLIYQRSSRYGKDLARFRQWLINQWTAAGSSAG